VHEILYPVTLKFVWSRSFRVPNGKLKMVLKVTKFDGRETRPTRHDWQ